MSEAETMRALISLHQGGGSGAVNSVVRLAAALADGGVWVRFVCPPDSPVEREARARGLEVHTLPLAQGGRITNARLLRRLLEQHPVDLIDSHGSRDREAFTWLGLTRRLPAPLVLTRRSWPRSTWLETSLAGRVASRVTVLSQPMIASLVRRGTPPAKLVVIPNGVLLDRIDQLVLPEAIGQWRARIGWDPGRRTVGIVARPKDQAVVLRALARVTTPVRLVLAGLDGIALSGVLPAIPERHAVVRLPFEPDIRPLYECLEIVLHPSRWDALPQAVLEALALGKPVIASNATGNAVIIRHGIDGLLVDPADPVAWGTALQGLLDDPARAQRLAAAGRRRARGDFPFARTVERTIALYRDVVNQARPGR